MNTMTRIGVCGVIAAGGLAGAAGAQAISGDADTFFVSRNAGSDGRVVTIVSDDNGSKCEVVVRGRDVSAKINGKPVPDDRVRWDGDRVVIEDGSGHEIHSFRVGSVGGAFAFAGGPDTPAIARFRAAESGHPPVMVGINQTEPGDALRWHLRLGDDQPAILVERVIDGLPAEEAGLHRYDVIVGIDGKDGASSAALQSALMNKHPGDKLELEVVSRGDRKRLVIELAPYEQDRLMATWVAAPEAPAAPAAPAAPDAFFPRAVPFPDADRDWGEYGRQLREKAMAEMKESLQRFNGPEREQVQRELEMALKEQEEALRERFDRAREEYERVIELRGNRLVLPERFSERAGQASTAVQDRLASVEDRLARLERELNVKLERLLDRLDREDDRRKDD